MRNQKGFTLIEMLIVLAVISLLFILLIPNLADRNAEIQAKSCDALVELAESQRLAYEIETETSLETAQQLEDEGYLEEITCNNGQSQLVYQQDADPAFSIEDSNG
ncbi:competence type IV pilus major pilin ComGC [Gracilibacillus halophilus]|uniref:competence type IV pilus major pilin ComGC n=1 Tax=Gracilibacillus halophilus TaxID=470864 RepID=UPI0003A83444|nr:competence type IV pilus major pilin ComGC [Gracilibacillus halophilus]